MPTVRTVRTVASLEHSTSRGRLANVDDRTSDGAVVRVS
jgi:hypothetical protein